MAKKKELNGMAVGKEDQFKYFVDDQNSRGISPAANTNPAYLAAQGKTVDTGEDKPPVDLPDDKGAGGGGTGGGGNED